MPPSLSSGEGIRVPALEAACAPFLPLAITSSGDRAPTLDARCHVLPGLSVGCFAGTPIRTERTYDHVAASADEVVLCIEKKARVHTVDAFVGERVFSPGEAHVWMAPHPAMAEVDKDFSALIIKLPRELIETGVADLGGVLRSGIRGAVPELRLLSSYAQGLVAEIGSMAPETVRRCVTHIHDLALLAFGPVRDAAEPARLRGLRAARLTAVKADIRANLNTPSLSLNWLAGRHNLSPRAIRDLFYGDGTSFTDYLLAVRLDRARDLLCDPARGGERITAIAFEVGFGDLSWFYQAFRRRFDTSPSDMRKAAQEAERN